MNSGNWIIDNLSNALSTWNAKLAEIWNLLTQSPETFKGGGIWEIIVNINGALQAVGYALLVLFFLIGVVKTCGSFVEIKRPEVALKMFVRFVLAKAAITYGLELMMALFRIVQGVISTVPFLWVCNEIRMLHVDSGMYQHRKVIRPNTAIFHER